MRLYYVIRQDLPYISNPDPSLTVLTQEMRFCIALLEMDGRTHIGLGKMTVHNQKI